MHFHELKLIDPLLDAVKHEGYTEPTPIQVQAIPHILAGRDMIGLAQTGTGKTAAFALPILQGLAATQPRRRGAIRALVLSPTRELAAQIGESFSSYGRNLPLKNAVIFGGVGQQPQIQAVQRGVDILIATPGRLLDLIGQKIIRLDALEIFVLDEADRMLDMGFIHDVRRVIAALPPKRQTLLFSATMPQAIQELADSILTSPVTVAVTPPATTVEKISQSVYFVEKRDKRALLEHLLNKDPSIRRVLVFTRTKHGANKLVEQLERGGINAEAIHSNKSQTARERALANFKVGKTRVLVATDIASRGIDVDDVTHVVNYDLPYEPESYVHRIGRTARAGASGAAFAFCDSEERKLLRDIERLIRVSIPVQTVPVLAPTASEPQAKPKLQERTQGNARPTRNPPRREESGKNRQAAPKRDEQRPSANKTAAQHTDANPYARLNGNYRSAKYPSYEAMLAAESAAIKENPPQHVQNQQSEGKPRRSRRPRRRYDRQTI